MLPGCWCRRPTKFRIYPDAKQEELFRRTVGCCRLIYNLCLVQKRLERERSNPRRLTAFDQMKDLTALKREFPFLKEPPNHPLQQAIQDLHKAFKNFFEGRAGSEVSPERAARQLSISGCQAGQDRRGSALSAESRLDQDSDAPSDRRLGEEVMVPEIAGD